MKYNQTGMTVDRDGGRLSILGNAATELGLAARGTSPISLSDNTTIAFSGHA